ncbi:hypothetical protein ACOMHN_062502 [Nucella lapillus]
MCMDIEANPGPEGNGADLFKFMDWKFTPMINWLQMSSTNLGRLVEEKFTAINEHFKRFETGLERLSVRVNKHSECIDELLEDKESIFERLDKLEENVDTIEKETKRCNLTFFGIDEIRPGEDYSSIEQIVDVLNYHDHYGEEWQVSDIEQAFLLGRAQYNKRDPRPMLVQFCNMKDKTAILRNRDLRGRLRSSGIKVTWELTTCQKGLVDFHCEQGKNAYYWNGRLQVEDWQSSHSRYKGRAQEIHNQYQDWSEDEHPFQEDWPQLQPSDQHQEPYSVQKGKCPFNPPEWRMHTGGFQEKKIHFWRDANKDWRPRWRRRENMSPEEYKEKDSRGKYDRDMQFSRQQQIPERQVFLKRSENGKKTVNCEDIKQRSIPIVPGHKSYSEAILSRHQTETRQKPEQYKHCTALDSRKQCVSKETAVKECVSAESSKRNLGRRSPSLDLVQKDEDTLQQQGDNVNIKDMFAEDVMADQRDPASLADSEEQIPFQETELYSKGFGQTDIRKDEDVGTDEDNVAAEDRTTHLDGTLTEQDAVDHEQEEESPHDTETDTQAPQTSGNNGHLDDEGEKQTEILSSDTTEDRQTQRPTGTLAGSQQKADCMPAPQDRPCRKKNPARGRMTRKTAQTRLNSQGSIIDSIRRAHSAEQGKDTQREKGNTASNNVAHKK